MILTHDDLITIAESMTVLSKVSESRPPHFNFASQWGDKWKPIPVMVSQTNDIIMGAIDRKFDTYFGDYQDRLPEIGFFH